jgi:hypothetical protein
MKVPIQVATIPPQSIAATPTHGPELAGPPIKSVRRPTVDS